MLSAERIRSLLEQAQKNPKEGLGCCPNPISVSEDQIGAASLDLRLGSWFLQLQQSRRSQIDLADLDDRGIDETDGQYFYVPVGKKFVIHPGRFVLAATLEWMRFPKNIGGMITGKSSLGRRGLIIETASGIQPDFNGCLTLEIFNCGEVPIAIVPGMKVAQIFFHEITGNVVEANSSFSGRRKPIFGTYQMEQCLVGDRQKSF